MIQKLLFRDGFETLPKNLKLIDKNLLISNFLAVSKPAKTSNNYHLIYNNKVLLKKNTTHFTNVNSLNIMINVLPQHSQNPFSFYKFSGKIVSGWYQIKHLHCTISRWSKTALPKLLKIKCLYNPVNLHQKIYVPSEKLEAYIVIWWVGAE